MRFYRVFLTCAVLVLSLPALGGDYHEGLAAYRIGDFEGALREWKPLAAGGDPESQYWVGRMYVRGEPEKDYTKAVKWYLAAAKSGHFKAQNNLGVLYEDGRGVEQDLKQAVRWYTEAAESGLPAAQSNLARMYDNGLGADQDQAEAAHWYREAALQGHVKSQYRLGVMYDQGIGVGENPGRAAKWYRKAARQDNGPAQAALGSMYVEGRGVGRDHEKAAKWLGRASAQGIAVVPLAVAAEIDLPPAVPDATSEPEMAAVDVETGSVAEPIVAAIPAPTPPPLPVPAVKSKKKGKQQSYTEYAALRDTSSRAEAGEVAAQYELAQMYGRGEGVEHNISEAARWYRAAAESGHEMAAYKLAFLYLRGRGLPNKDYVQAYRWFGVSAELGMGDADDWQTKIAAKMTQDEVAQAEALLEQWKTEEQDP